MGRSDRPTGRWCLTAAVTAGLLVLAACSSGPKAPTSGAVSNGGSITFALDEGLAGFNVLQANDAEFVLAEILQQTWPNVFIIPPSLKPTLDTSVVTSATVTRTNPQTVVYHINPRATWSDGVPVSAADFIYNWQAQSGNPRYKDVGGKAFLPATTSGYNQISSVTGSDLGKTVTVVFSRPYGDWKSLFSPLIPAHVAEKVGFDNGFQTFGPAVQVSAGPYMIKSYTQDQDLVEVPNPHYWGPKPHLSQIIYRFILDDNQIPPAVQNGEAQLVNPALASTAFYDDVRGISGFTTTVQPGLEFQHIDFNEANPYLALAAIRHAIAYGTNRAQMVQRIVDPMEPGGAVLNNRIWMATQPQYQDTSAGQGAYDPAKAKQLLAASGMTMGPDGYFHPDFGPEKGKDFTLSISTTSGVEVRSEIEQLFQADMKAIGVKITIQNYSANTLFGTVGPDGEFDIIEFAWVLNPFASGNQSIYCSYTDKSVCGLNWDHYANPQVDKLFDQADGTLDPARSAALYNQIDSLLWKAMVTLPLFQQPQLTGYSDRYAQIIPNTSAYGVTWNAEDWGIRAG